MKNVFIDFLRFFTTEDLKEVEEEVLLEVFQQKQSRAKPFK
jgi:hypothetical protein